MITRSNTFLCAELYLLLPILLWLCGWFQPWLAYPLAALLLAAAAWHVYQVRFLTSIDNPPADEKSISSWHLIVYILLSAAAVLLIGLDGRIVQSYDLIVRNPLYDEIVRQEWPVRMPDGRYVVYALMYWLPAGLLSTWFPSLSQVFLQLWILLGMVLICLTLHFKLGLWRTLFFWGSILCFSPLTGTVDDVLNTVFIKDAIMGVHFRMPSPLTQFFNTFHYFIPTCLFLAVTMTVKCSIGRLVVLSSCYAVLHPMVAATAIPFLAVKVYREHLSQGLAVGLKNILRAPELYPSMVLVVLSMVFYFSVSGCWFAFTFNTPYAHAFDASGVALCLTAILLSMLLPLAVYWCNRDYRLVLTAFLCPLLILVWYGANNGVNEWLYKFSVLYGFFVAYGLVSARRTAALYALIGLLSAASVIPFLREMKRKNLADAARHCFAVQEKNFSSSWRGTLYHPESSMYTPLTADKLKLPFLFKG